MKPIWWVVIITSFVSVIIGLSIIVTRVFSDPPKTWWITGGIAIGLALIGGGVGIVMLILKLKKKQPQKSLIDEDDAEERAKILLMYDNDFPDNFMRKDRVIKNVGEAGKERTPVLWLMGSGSETKAKIDILVNLTNPKIYPLFLINRSNQYVLETIITYAENPSQVEVEEKVLGRDEFGMPTTTLRTRRMSRAEQKEEESKKEAEEMNAY